MRNWECRRQFDERSHFRPRACECPCACSPPVSIVNGRIGWRWDNGWRIQLDALNPFNARTNQITYAYGSLIKSDNLYNLCFPRQIAPAAVCQNGVMDSVLHPIEPLAIRVTLAGAF